MKAIVTGATGAIGVSLVKILENNKIDTLVLLHRGSPRNRVIKESEYVRIAYCNVDEYDLFDAEDTYDLFFHMAWVGGSQRNDIYTHYKNVEYAISALKLAGRLGCGRFIFTGSQAEYGLHNSKLSGNTSCDPVSVFGASKLYAGYMTRFLSAQMNIDHIWCRILSVYGPHDGEQTMVSSVLKKMISGEDIDLTGCEQIWDYIYCDDAAKAVYLCGTKGIAGKIYPVGSGEEKPLKEYVEDMFRISESSSCIGWGKRPYGDNQVMYLSADIKELVEDTGFAVEIPFEKGIKNTIDWIKTCEL